MSALFAGKTRAMAEADLDAVMAMAAALPTAPHWQRETYARATKPDAVPARIALVAEAESGELAGFVVASLIAPEAELESIVTAAGFQRRGVGRALLDALSGALRTREVSELHLEVRASNDAARALYAAAGFVESGVRPRYYADPVEDAVLFRLDLEQTEPESTHREED